MAGPVFSHSAPCPFMSIAGNQKNFKVPYQCRSQAPTNSACTVRQGHIEPDKKFIQNMSGFLIQHTPYRYSNVVHNFIGSLSNNKTLNSACALIEGLVIGPANCSTGKREKYSKIGDRTQKQQRWRRSQRQTSRRPMIRSLHFHRSLYGMPGLPLVLPIIITARVVSCGYRGILLYVPSGKCIYAEQGIVVERRIVLSLQLVVYMG